MMKVRLQSLPSVVVNVSVFIYGMVVLLDPTNSILHLKIPAFAFCLIGWFLFSKREVNPLSVLVIFLSWLCIGYGMLISSISLEQIDESYKNQISNLYFLSLLFLPLSSFNKNQLLSLTFKLGLVLASVIWILYLMYSFTSYGRIMYQYFTLVADMTIMIAKRSTLGINMTMFFYKTVPFLLLPLAYVLTSFKKRRRIVYGCFFLFPIIIGGSRTPILCALLLIGIAWYFNSNSKGLKNLFLLFCGAGFLYLLVNIVVEAQASKELKFDSYDSYIIAITHSIKSLLFGNGIGSVVEIPSRGYMAYSELSILDLYNQYGVIVGSCFLLLLLYPGIALARMKNSKIKIYGWAYVLYMLISATNPLLFSSTGWFVWTLVTSIFIRISAKQTRGLFGYLKLKKSDGKFFSNI